MASRSGACRDSILTRSLHLMEKGIICGNELAWSPDNKTMHFDDSVAMMVWAYDFELESGSTSNERQFIDRRSSYVEVDGMVADTEGNLWIAMFASNRVMVFSPRDEHLKGIVFSVYNMACTTWGGRNSDIPYLASGRNKNSDGKADDERGHMFRFKPRGVTGLQKFEFDG